MSHSGLRIVHLDSGREMRGGQWQALALHEGLLARGIESLLLARDEAPLQRLARDRALPVAGLTFRKIWLECRRGALLHAHDAATHTLACLAGARRLVVSRRVVFPVKHGVFSQWKYRKASLYLAVSEAVRGELLRAGVSASRIRVVYDGVQPLPLPDLRRDVVVLDSDDPGKCADLARAAARLGDFPLVFSRDLPSAFHNGAIFLYLSRAEGLGSAALLAMSAGIPVVASRIPALAEVVEDGVTGILVDNHPSEVAAAINTLRRDPEHARGMGLAGRAIAHSRFSIDQMVENTLSAYESL
ncbi:MAG: glycosyltransferase family 4 protein [Bryobacterales bacterium]|nr:glycosyltransferase family 4 protein [Bryobacterales bacterium]